MSTLDKICQKVLITDYLQAKGIEVVGIGGRRPKCCCPLHEEKTPSFYIGEFPDGAQYFKCFGCNSAGNVITLIRLMENKKGKQVVKELAREHGISLQGFDPGNVRLEPMPEDVLMHFCESEYPAMNIATYGRMFLQAMGNSTDAINKVNRLYKKLDKMLERGDDAGIEEIYEEMGNLLVDLGEREWLINRRHRIKSHRGYD